MGRWSVLGVGLVGLLGVGCIESHPSLEGEDGGAGDAALAADRALPGDPLIDRGLAVDAAPRDAEPVVDAEAAADAEPVVDAAPAPDAALPPADEACARAIAAARAGQPPAACTALPEACVVPMNPCCSAYFVCEAGRAAVYLTCDDSCAQGCSTYSRENCALDPTCTWFETSACGPGPEGSIDVSSCAPRRLGPCGADGACPEGQRCQDFLVEACVDSECDACASVERACVW